MRPDIGLAAVPTLSPRLRGESRREGFHNRGEVPPLPGPLLHTGVEEREKKRRAIHWRNALEEVGHGCRNFGEEAGRAFVRRGAAPSWPMTGKPFRSSLMTILVSPPWAEVLPWELLRLA